MAGLEIAKRSIRGSLVLFFGSLLSAVFSAIAIFLIARLLGPEGYGEYSLALIIPGLLQLFIGFGVNNSVIRYAAYSISIGKPEEARRYTSNAIYFIWLTGAAFTALNYLLANVLPGVLLGRPALSPYVQLLSVAVIGQALFLTITFTALGWNWMALSSLSGVFQSAIRLVLAPVLIVVGFGIAGALTGYSVSLIAAGLVGTAVLYYAKMRGSTEPGSFVSDIRHMLGFGLPIYAGGLAASLATYFGTIVLASIASNTVYGYYQAALNFLLPVTLVSNSLVNSLFPAFASLDGIGGDVKIAFTKAYKFVAFLITPLILFLVAAPSVLTRAFYGATFAGSIPYLRLLALAYLPIAFGYTVHPSFFAGFGRPRLTFLVYASGAVTLVIGAPLLAIWADLGVDGVIYAIFLSYFVAWAVGTYLADRYMKARLDLRANGAILVSSVVSFLATAGLSIPFSIIHSTLLQLVLDLVVFALVYLSLAPLTGAINGKDLDIIEHTFKDLKGVNRLSGILLRFERGFLALRGKSD